MATVLNHAPIAITVDMQVSANCAMETTNQTTDHAPDTNSKWKYYLYQIMNTSTVAQPIEG